MVRVKAKLLSWLLVVLMIVSLIPMTALATGTDETIDTEEELITAIENADYGQTLTLGDDITLSEALTISYKDMNINLNGHTISCSEDVEAVIIVECCAVTIDGDGGIKNNGSLAGSCAIKVVSDEWEQYYSKLYINGGTYEAAASDGVAVVAGARTVAVITGGTYKNGLSASENADIIVKAGTFTADPKDYLASSAACEQKDGVYVVTTPMSDEFKKILNAAGKFDMYSTVPTSEDECMLYFNENEKFWDKYPDYRFDNFSDDYSSCDICYKYDSELSIYDEVHRVDIVYHYDESVKTLVDKIVAGLPEGEDGYGYFYAINDMELVNWWINSREINTLIDYSSELKSYIQYKNFTIDCRMGLDAEFLTEASGFAPFMYDDIMYRVVDMGVRAKHIIYVPDGTQVTKDALIAAVQKRIDEYAGAGTVNVTYGGQGIRDYYENLYNSEIAEYQALVDKYSAEIEEYQALLDATEEGTDEYIEYSSKIQSCTMEKMNYESAIQNTTSSKEYILSAYDEEDGDFYYLQSAAGDYWFNLEVGDCTYMFIVVVDSDGMVTPEYKSSDVATDVTVEANDSSIPLDTRINVDKLTSGTVYEEIINTLKVKENLTFDIKLFSNSLEKYISKLANGKFQVKIPVGVEFKDKSLVVYYVGEDKKIQEYEVSVKDGYAIFSTEHFSIYTLAEKPEEVSEQTPEIEVNNGSANVTEDVVNDAIKDAGASETVTLPLEEVAKEVKIVKLPVNALKEITKVKKALAIETAKALVTIDIKALEKIVKDAGDNLNISFEIDEVKQDKLTVKQQEAIKDREVKQIISAEILCNNEKITEFGGGKIKVQIPLSLGANEKGSDYKVIYIADDGKTEDIATTYEDGCIVVELEHFSEYAIVKKGAEAPITSDNSLTWLWMGILGICAIACVGISDISKKRQYIGR